MTEITYINYEMQIKKIELVHNEKKLDELKACNYQGS